MAEETLTNEERRWDEERGRDFRHRALMAATDPAPDSLADFGQFALSSVLELEAENKELRRQNDNLREALAEAHRDLATLAVQIDDAEKELDLMAAR